MLLLPFTQARIPVGGARLISRQGPRPRRRTWHHGIDLGAVPIGTPIYPVAPGLVDDICLVDGWRCCAYGNAVRIKHAEDLYSFYAHMDRVDVSVGQSVDPDRAIGTVGNTFRDRHASGCPALPMVEHLHLEFRHGDGSRYDVLQVLAASGVGVRADGTLGVVAPFEYQEPLLVGMAEKANEYREVIVGDPSLLISRSGVWWGLGAMAVAGIAAVVAGLRGRHAG